MRSLDSYLTETEASGALVSAKPGPAHVAMVLQEGSAFLLSVVGEWCRMTNAHDVLWQDLDQLRQALREEVRRQTRQPNDSLDVVLDQSR